MQEEKQWFSAELSSTSAVFSIGIFKEEMEFVVAENLKFEYRSTSTQIALLGKSGLSKICSMDQNKRILIRGVLVWNGKFSMETMVGKIIPVVLRKKSLIRETNQKNYRFFEFSNCHDNDGSIKIFGFPIQSPCKKSSFLISTMIKLIVLEMKVFEYQ